jgi:hypothetical protein
VDERVSKPARESLLRPVALENREVADRRMVEQPEGMERFRAKAAGSQEIVPVTLRTTTIFRPEDGTWKVVHRHADPINSPQ